MHPSENARLNSGRASRFVSGAASEIDRKYHAASGSVSAVADRVQETPDVTAFATALPIGFFAIH